MRGSLARIETGLTAAPAAAGLGARAGSVKGKKGTKRAGVQQKLSHSVARTH